jgi:PEP-CTERM motif
MRLPIKLLSLAILATAFAAKADTLDFTITGDGNTFTFSLPSNPTPDSFSNGVSFTLANILITEGLTSFSSDITFYNINDPSHDGGLLFLLPSLPPPTPPESVDLVGAQVYETTSPEASPIFSPATFTLMEGNPKGDTFTVDIAPAVPEPSSISLLATGILALGATVRRKFSVR